jgi:chromosome segregation ATPase
MVTHLSKKLAPVQSTEQLNAALAVAQKETQRHARDNTKLSSQCAKLEARNATYISELNAQARSNAELMRNYETLSREHSLLQEQSQRQRQRMSSLQKQLSECEDGREQARERVVTLRKKVCHFAVPRLTLVDLGLRTDEEHD